MHTTNLRRVGGSVMLAVPPALLDVLNLSAGTTVGVSVEDGRLVIAPARAKRYKLADLIAECDASTELPETDKAWTSDAPVGNELI